MKKTHINDYKIYYKIKSQLMFNLKEPEIKIQLQREKSQKTLHEKY